VSIFYLSITVTMVTNTWYSDHVCSNLVKKNNTVNCFNFTVLKFHDFPKSTNRCEKIYRFSVHSVLPYGLSQIYIVSDVFIKIIFYSHSK
jgi:hypothetical protein